MPLRTTDTILSDRIANPEAVLARLDRPSDADRAFAFALVRYCRVAGVDPVLALVQWLLETANATSPRWVNDLNSSGIGIVANDTKQPFRVPSINAAAALHVQCLYSLATRRLAPDVPLWAAAYAWMDDVWLPKVQSRAMPDVEEVSDLGLRYTEHGQSRATWSWEDGKVSQDTYGKKLASRALQMYPDAPDQKENEPVAMTFGKVPRPPMVEMIVSKPNHNGSAYGYDRVAPRKPVGLVHHETQGTGSGQWYHDFFSCPDGERCRNALVDFLIDKAGTIFMFNDPFGTRAGWANGGGVGSPGGLEGDGPAFYAKFGAAGINQRLVSIEYVKTTSENFTDAQVQAGGALAAWIHDKDGQRWDEHPYTSKYGLVTSFLHFEFGTTNCGKGELDDITRVQAATKGIMRKWQENGSSDPVDPDVPPLPEPEIPGGLTLEEAQRRFGTATRYKDGKVTTGLGFDPDGPISLAWAHRAAVEKTWPQIEAWYVVEDSGQALHVVTFANDWRLVLVHERQGWQWMDYKVIQEAA